MKIRKVKRGKTFRYNVNRKRLRKTRTSTGKIKCSEVKQHWEEKRSIRTNLKEMGLAIDPNQAVGIPNIKQDRLKIVKMVNGFMEEDSDNIMKEKSKRQPRKAFVAEKLEKEAKAPGDPQFRLPKGVVGELTYFLDKFQLSYNAMVMDRKNFNQWTWRQFRSKIKRFMSIPEQFDEYLKNKNLTRGDIDKWVEYDTDQE